MPRTGRGVALGLLLAVATAPTAYAACGTHTFTRQCVAFSNGDAPLTFSIQNTRNLCKAACEAFLDANNAGEGCCQYHKVSTPLSSPTGVRSQEWRHQSGAQQSRHVTFAVIPTKAPALPSPADHGG